MQYQCQGERIGTAVARTAGWRWPSVHESLMRYEIAAKPICGSCAAHSHGRPVSSRNERPPGPALVAPVQTLVFGYRCAASAATHGNLLRPSVGIGSIIGGGLQAGENAEPISAITRFASAGGSLGHVAVERVRLARHDNGPVDQVYVSLLVWQTAVWCRWGQRGFPAGPPVALRPHNLSRIS